MQQVAKKKLGFCWKACERVAELGSRVAGVDGSGEKRGEICVERGQFKGHRRFPNVVERLDSNVAN
jgi:hypothetical protein